MTQTDYSINSLANPGKEYLVLQPNQRADLFTVILEAGDYTVEWFHVGTRETKKAGTVRGENAAPATFTPPFSDNSLSLLFLKRIYRRTNMRIAFAPIFFSLDGKV